MYLLYIIINEKKDRDKIIIRKSSSLQNITNETNINKKNNIRNDYHCYLLSRKYFLKVFKKSY